MLLSDQNWSDKVIRLYPKEEAGSDCFSHNTLQSQGYELLSPISHKEREIVYITLYAGFL